MSTPSRNLLDREAPAKLVEQHLRAQCDMLKELADYGAELIWRAYDASAKQLTEAIAIGVLLKQVVAMVDAAEELVRIAAIHAANLQARAACEASFYLEWMLQSDSENKAKHYYVASLREQRQWAVRATKGTPENEKFVDNLSKAGIDDQWATTFSATEATNYVERVSAILAQEALAGIANSFDEYAKKRRGNVQWYQPLGAPSIAKIASDVGRAHEYAIFYSKGSNVIHSGSHFDHIEFLRSGLRLKKLRSLHGSNELIMQITNLAMRTYRVVIERYIPSHKQEFGRLWLERWREPFRSIPVFVFKAG